MTSSPQESVPTLRRRLARLAPVVVLGLVVAVARGQDIPVNVPPPRPTLPVPASPGLPSLVLIGDSTVRNGRGDGSNGQWGWGEPLAALFDTTRINVVNRALGGRSSRTYQTQGLWSDTLALLKPGDFLVIQFGHNDGGPVNDNSRARGTLKGVGEETEEIDNLLTGQHEVVHTFGWYMRKYLVEAKAKGVRPIVCSLVPRKVWKDGRIERGSADYALWAAQVAAAEGVAFVDLNEIVARRYDEMGPVQVEALFADERTHTTRAGAEINAASVVAGLEALGDCPLCRFLAPEQVPASAPSPKTQAGTPPPLPRLEKRGTVTQLIVDGQPYLALAGELRNSSSSSLEYLRPVWARLVQMRLNTVLAAVSWEQIEPAQGRYDFRVVDGLLAEARRRNLRLALLWFGSWKNGTSRYAADWVKLDQERYPRVRNKDGRTLEILSPLGDATREADARAFAALLSHLRAVDEATRTVIMIQVQNEVGVLGDSRDRSAAAEAAFAQPVPAELTAYLQQHRETLAPELRGAWEAAGAKAAGTWPEVFGPGPATDELFMAWSYARYLDCVAAAGKAEYALPMFVNAWIVQPEDKGPGDYPSGGPVAHVHDVWRAGAPAIDILAPDIYLPDFPEVVARYSHEGRALFIPESRAGAGGVANAFYAIGQHGAIGYSPFAIEEREADPENGPISKAYGLLSSMASLVLEHQARGLCAGFWLTKEKPKQSARLGNYTLHAELRRTRRAPDVVPELGYALALAVGPNEYVIAGSDVQITFTPSTGGSEVAGLLSVEEGAFRDGSWVAGRRLNGDEVQLRYDLSVAAESQQAGTGLRFLAGGPTLQRVKLYRYR